MKASMAFGLALALTTTLVVSAYAAAPPYTGVYEGPGIVVTNFNFGSGQIGVVDNGAVVCQDTDANGMLDYGRGGVCLPFGTLYRPWNNYADAISVTDGQHDPVFQVCVDLNGDGICRDSGESEGGRPFFVDCDTDLIWYSHDSRTGANHNPLYIETDGEFYWNYCGNETHNGFAGYVVILCAGFHDNHLGSNPHTHAASAGFIEGAHASYYGPRGDFCGAPTAAKLYEVVW